VFTDFFDAHDLHGLVFERYDHPCPTNQRDTVLPSAVSLEGVKLEGWEAVQICGALAIGENANALDVSPRDRFPEPPHRLLGVLEALPKSLRPKTDAHPVTAPSTFTLGVNSMALHLRSIEPVGIGATEPLTPSRQLRTLAPSA
jgi:hypothetical protein